MKVFHSINAASQSGLLNQGAILTIGDFDGCHVGHKQLLETTSKLAKTHNLVSVVLTFDPSPKVFFSRSQPNNRIFQFDDKLNAIAKSHLDVAISHKFDEGFSRLSYQQFFEEIVQNTLNVKHIVLGFNFRFGKLKEGNIEKLEELCNQSGIGLTVIEAETVNDKRVSSTFVREEIANGNLQSVANLLGEPYHITGKVLHGRKVGRTIGFPTANLENLFQVFPGQGVYCGYCDLSPQPFPYQVKRENLKSVVINVGTRPTVEDQGGISIEVHVLDGNLTHDLYDTVIRVYFLEKIRAEKKFGSIDDLKQQIAADAKVALEKITEQHMDWLK